MAYRRELLMWIAVVCALGFVLLAALQSSLPVSSQSASLAERDGAGPVGSIGGPGDTGFDLAVDELVDVYEQAADSAYKPTEFMEYQVQQGDNLWKIAKRFGKKADFWYTLLSVNKLENANDLRVGQTIRIPDQPGILHCVQEGDTLEDIALRYDVSMEAVAGANQIRNPAQIVVDAELFVPNARITLADQRRLEEESNIPVGFVWPTRSRRITSSYGYRRHPITRRRTFHKGMDIGCGTHAAVYAVADGVVTFSGRMGGYGNLVVIRHSQSFETRYAHNSRLKVRKGQRVSQGKVIAFSGNTGRTNGPHLHFEIWKNGKVQNPAHYLR